MNSILLKYSDKFAPAGGTIVAHNEVINRYGYVWYGKIGQNLAKAKVEQVVNQDDPFIILYNGATDSAYKAAICGFCQQTPDDGAIPEYYSRFIKHIKAWFKVTSFEPMESSFTDFYITSSGEVLQRTKKASMSSFFYITRFEKGESPRNKEAKKIKIKKEVEEFFDFDDLDGEYEDLSDYDDLLAEFE